jgi:hypothetical protein
LGLNDFADLTNEEFTETYLGYLPSKKTESKKKVLFIFLERIYKSSGLKAADAIDWR